MRRVVVTGIGMVTPLGNSAVSTWQGLFEGKCGIDRIDSEEFKSLPVQIGGVPKFQPDSWTAKIAVKTLCNAYALAACTEALEQAKYKDIKKNDLGIVLDSCTSELVSTAQQFKKQENQVDRLASMRLLLNLRSTMIAEHFGISGKNDTVLSPLGGLGSVGQGFYSIQDGNSKATLVVGTQHCVEPIHIKALHNLGLLNTYDNGTPNNAMRPYDQSTKGMVLGEGATALVLEDYEHAINRGAEIFAEILSFARSNDAMFLLKSDEEGTMMAKTIELSIERAKIDQSSIEFVIGEGSGIHERDRSEMLGLTKTITFPSITTYKAALGNMLAASGPTQAALGAISVKEDAIFPIHNFSSPFRVKGSKLKAQFVTKGIKAPINTLLLTGMGFGGNNYAMILAKNKIS